MMGYATDRRMADDLNVAAGNIVAGVLGGDWEVATPELDNFCATDLIVNGYKIAVRTRQSKYFKQYPHDFTIRFDRISGRPSEMEKIMEGHGDFMFYAYMTENKRNIWKWMLVDLAEFRQYAEQGKMSENIRRNQDASTRFVPFTIGVHVPANVVKATNIEGIGNNQ